MSSNDPLQPPSAGSAYPVTTTFNLPERVARWRPLVHWLLAIPHFIVLYFINLVTTVVVVVGWFAGIITGKVPEFVVQFVALNTRYSTRVSTFLFFTRESYPPFDFDLTFADNGKDPDVRVDFVPQLENRSRISIFFRGLLVIPHIIVLYVLILVLYVVLFIGWFAVIILGRWPAGLLSYLLGFTRWINRLNAYMFLATDEYPPFSFK
ncbi:hypothetical protein ASD11_15930 [Aeromicrobium sp. Root495]|uniref:DUF4389 domain-containing protein n=1 Tax=Aeromicrobium sp. Root495 TaxID=1736550 RepID=UPI000700523F|nr:DUF4389 domain-containing protein [Aeromicrobium sp. Root495]KQY55970.1 hypothetical protein ASD11_15930 [Aeromicrobium sp. Root495]RYJ06819.1 MAG: DUF4389 domain-containing protein [Actinomycetales bacterium]